MHETIGSKADYLRFLDADIKALGVKRGVRAFLFDEVWRFQRLLRLYEYRRNCKGSKVLLAFTALRFRRLSRMLGFTIPPNVFGPGLSIAHYGTIVVNSNARVGSGCRLHVCVNIGAQAGAENDAPTIGDNCYIGPGAKIFGRIVIGDNVAIGANSVVNKSFGLGGCTIGGVPARVISSKTSEGLLVSVS